ncbi:uncharacterized protein NESG_00738 [Nematocida ausubeli]|uniref:Anamorsin C-terminal domain-containing protein n=1 Tax=Nematocida ausubeli (strain ATCC PRA-371 / ERTm2) TaxID=1913371 RepID=A0A086J369_NEMA1|nr:uncharacterized protein NESG_00738 [Nematocida ausubeli]KFG26587.1 hypothetical protein NESG_00738 [Nematocida ausubeli]
MVSDFVSEDELIYPEDMKDLIKPVRKERTRACANCTCGKKEAILKDTLKEEDFKPFESSCGNCNLGDAFRCTSCPYKGLPPFVVNSAVEFSPDEI